MSQVWWDWGAGGTGTGDEQRLRHAAGYQQSDQEHFTWLARAEKLPKLPTSTDPGLACCIAPPAYYETRIIPTNGTAATDCEANSASEGSRKQTRGFVLHQPANAQLCLTQAAMRSISH